MKKNGFSLIETLIATGLLSAFVTATGMAYLNMQKAANQAVGTFVGSSQVDNIINNIRTNVQSYQVNFDTTITPSTTLDINTLPMAWDVNTITTTALCPHCKGRYGFYIQPIPNAAFPGLNNVVVRISNTDWHKNTEITNSR